MTYQSILATGNIFIHTMIIYIDSWIFTDSMPYIFIEYMACILEVADNIYVKQFPLEKKHQGVPLKFTATTIAVL